jgi:U3 small nucleolar RNA-associated protein 23
MKIKRYKRAQRLIGFYRNNFGYTTKPYRVLVDGTFCQAALTNRINLREQVSKYLNEETELATTSCVLKELGSSQILHSSANWSFVYCRAVGSGIVWCAAHLQAVWCRSVSAQTSQNSCRLHRIHGSTHETARQSQILLGHTGKIFGVCFYKWACWALNMCFSLNGILQDNALTDKLRMIAGCPILFIKFNSILIDKPSEVSVEEAERPKGELQKVKEMKKELLGLEEPIKQKKRKGPKGPNPLSCKKKKSKNMARLSMVKRHTDADETDEKDSRKRKRKSRRKSAGVDAKVAKIE